MGNIIIFSNFWPWKYISVCENEMKLMFQSFMEKKIRKRLITSIFLLSCIFLDLEKKCLVCQKLSDPNFFSSPVPGFTGPS